jgi:hypothetical protein
MKGDSLLGGIRIGAGPGVKTGVPGHSNVLGELITLETPTMK